MAHERAGRTLLKVVAFAPPTVAFLLSSLVFWASPNLAINVSLSLSLSLSRSLALSRALSLARALSLSLI